MLYTGTTPNNQIDGTDGEDDMYSPEIFGTDGDDLINSRSTNNAGTSINDLGYELVDPIIYAGAGNDTID